MFLHSRIPVEVACVTVVRVGQDKQMINTGEVRSADAAAPPESHRWPSEPQSAPNKTELFLLLSLIYTL